MKTLYIYLSNIFHVTGTEITVYKSLCQKTGSRAATLNYGFHPDLSYWLFVRLRKKKKVKQKLPSTCCQRQMSFVKGNPKTNQNQHLFSALLKMQISLFSLRCPQTQRSVCSLYTNYQDSDKLPSF